MNLNSFESFSLERFVGGKYNSLIAVGVLGILVNILFSLQFAIDDSFIAFRYAKNLVEHGIWNWNPDGDVVEAYTSFVYAALSVLPELINLAPTLFFKILGMLILVATIFRIYRRSRSKMNFILAFLFLSLNVYYFLHLFSGLETPLFILLVFEIVSVFAFAENRSEAYFCVLIVLLPLTRPEGIFFSAAALYCYGSLRGLTVKQRAGLALSAICLIGYFVWRWSYFGNFFPNTFYAKMFRDFSIINVLNNTGEGVFSLFCLGVISVFSLNKHVRAFAITAILVCLCVYVPSTLAMNFAERFFFQIVFPLCLVSLCSFEGISLSGTALLAAALVFRSVGDPVEIKHLASSYVKLVHTYKETALVLKDYKERRYTLLVGDAGIIPYYSELKCFDWRGLADKEIVHDGLSVSYLGRANPDIVLLHGAVPDHESLNYIPVINMIYEYVRSSDRYEFAGAVKVAEGSFLMIFLKRSMDDIDDMKGRLSRISAASMSFKIDKLRYLKQGYFIEGNSAE